jgi:hypothetical protein
LAVIATLTKGYDLDYIWRQVDRGPTRDAASYYIQASETGGEPPAAGGDQARVHSAWNPARSSTANHTTCCSANGRPRTAPPLGRPPGSGRKAADIYVRLLTAEPHATAERKRQLRLEATRQARQIRTRLCT